MPQLIKDEMIKNLCKKRFTSLEKVKCKKTGKPTISLIST